MINDEPDARGLVAIALQTFRDSILPAVPAERRFEALMIANALSIAERELAAEPEPALAAAIGGLIGESGDLETLARVCARPSMRALSTRRNVRRICARCCGS